MDLTKCELEVMNVFWTADKPLSRMELLSLSGRNKSWKDNSVHILLNSLLGKGALVEAGYARSGRTYGRLFGANISAEEYYGSTFFSPSTTPIMPKVISALVYNERLTPEMLEDLDRMVQERRKDMGLPPKK